MMDELSGLCATALAIAITVEFDYLGTLVVVVGNFVPHQQIKVNKGGIYLLCF